VNGSVSRKLWLAFLFLCCQRASGQYILNGSAQKVSCNCYTLTNEQLTQSGSVWNSNKIDLRNSFDYWFNVFLGCKDPDGADGIVFILQPISTSVGSTGEGMGFGGVAPSIGIALDTWQNPNLSDPGYDHISIQSNGNIDHNSDLAGPVPVSATSDNIEDCKWHVLRISWNAGTKTLSAYFDGSLRLERQVDLVSTIFNNDPLVFWGFTGATGGAFNLQQFCTALNPIFAINNSIGGGCVDEPIQFSDASESFAPIVSYNWSFGDGTFSNEKSPPPKNYSAPGRYPVNLKIKGQDGCEKDSTITVTVGSVPVASLYAFDTCFRAVPRYQLVDSNIGVSYQWTIDGQPFSMAQQPPLTTQSEGPHQLQVVVTSDFGCGPPASTAAAFTVKPLPAVNADVEDGCAGEALSFNGVQTDNQTTITQWHWRFGDGGSAASQNAQHRYNNAGQYSVQLSASATNGCTSDTLTTTINVNKALANAGQDTAVITGYPFQLLGSGNGTFLWSPAQGLSNPTDASPTITLTNDQQFVLTVTTAEGCVGMDTVLIRTFKGPAIYVPTAFTPNGDGKNDILKPLYVGIKALKQFAVYNRWGQAMFSTKEMNRGWDGCTAPSGTYVWLVQATDAGNRPVTLKGP
jgi:gliding motility-associated-like protein